MKVKFVSDPTPSLGRVEITTSVATHSFEFFNWYGLKNHNTSLFEYYYFTHCKGQRGLTFMPLRFWEDFHFTFDMFKERKWRQSKRRRALFGIGLISFFFDYKYKS